MKTFINSAMLILFLFFSVNLKTQAYLVSKSIKEGIALSLDAYLQYDKEKFIEARSIFEIAYNKDKSNLLPLYYITLIDYKILEVSMQDGGETLFDKYYEPALKNAEVLSNDKDFAADGKILSAAIYMMRIATSSMSAVTLSPKIHSLLDEAQQIAPQKPYSYVVRGIMKYKTPGIFGGSYEDALKNFNYAIKLFENDKKENSINPAWGYIETLAWAGQTQEKLDNNEAALFIYKKALIKEPEFEWIKYSLLPSLEEEINNQ